MENDNNKADTAISYAPDDIQSCYKDMFQAPNHLALEFWRFNFLSWRSYT